MQRRLVAILAADVVGYSRLMGDDEIGALSALRQMRSELFAPTVAGHKGKVVKSMGDGWLVEFSSAVNAVNCAMKIQDRLAGHEIIKLRIGVHMGDVAFEDDDIFGDGVNVSSRLQEIAEPGAVVISDAIFGALDGTLRPSFDDQGEQSLKNIFLPIRIWTRGGDIAGGSQARKVRAGFPELSIVPVESSDGRAEIQELASALTNDVVTYLGATQWLRTSVRLKPDSEIYITKNILRTRGDRIRLESTLIAPNGVQLWAGKHDGKLETSFDWQDKTSTELVTNIYGRILDNEALILDNTPESEWTAEQLFTRGLSLAGQQTAENQRLALDYLSKAIALSPDWGYLYTIALAVLHSAISLGISEQIAPYLAKQGKWATKAEALEPAASPAHAILAFAKLVRTGDKELVLADLNRLLRYLPFDPDVLLMGGYLFLYTGEPKPALDCFKKLSLFAMQTPYVSGIHKV